MCIFAFLLRARPLAVLPLALASLSAPGRAALPPNFQNEVLVATGLTYPTALEFLPDGRMLISEFHGRLVVVQPGASSIDPTPVLQLANIFIEEASAGGERGMTNVVAHPQFAQNGYIYLYYTADNPQRDRVSRFTMTGNTATPASEQVIWQAAESAFSDSHHGGGMVFDTQGKLFISTGDNTVAADAQALDSDRGKLMRFNDDGSIPADNPFVDGAGSNVDAIWARGLRNAFRLHQDSVTGRIFIGDVGQFAVEEVNVAVRGANYGWPNSEGPTGTAGITNPIHSYDHDGSDASVTGGVTYRGTQFPAQYQGVYFYGDYAQNWIRTLTFNGAGTVISDAPFQPVNGSHNTSEVGDPVCFKVGPDGSLYYVDFGWSQASNPATIRRIRYTAVNQPPVVAVSATPETGAVPLQVAFSSAGSSDPEGQPLTYEWTFGDGSTSTDASPVHVYTQSGLYTARLALSDGAQITLSSVLTISAGNTPVGEVTNPANNLKFQAGQQVAFSGTGTDTEDGTLPPAAYSWTILFHHDTHVHPTLGPLSGVTSSTFTIPDTGHDFGGTTRYEIILTVTDSDGLIDTTSVFIQPEKVNLSFASVPAGLPLLVDGIEQATPFVKDTLIGFRHSVAAPDVVDDGALHEFLSWSDGGAQTHQVTVPGSSATYTATFDVVPLPLPEGLVVAYSFDEGSGATAADGSGNARDGTLVNGASWSAAGRHGGAIALDGTNDFVRVDNPGLPTGDFTYSCWVKLDSYREFQTIASVNGGTPGLEINAISDRLAVVSNVSGAALTADAPIPLDAWTHIAVVRSGNDLRAYHNGELDTSTGATSGPQDLATCAMLIGADADSGCLGSLNGYFDGALDEFRVYNRALSPAEIATDMESPLVPDEATYATWAAAQEFETPADADPSSDPNSNGFSNLADYAFGIDPVAPGGTPLLTSSFVTEGGAEFAVLSYRRPGGPNRREDVSYLGQHSANLSAWSTTGLIETIGPLNPDGTETVTLRTTLPLDEETRQFLRLFLSLQP